MLKWLLIFMGVSTLAVTIALVVCKDERTREDERRASAKLTAPPATGQSQGNDTANQGCDCTAKSPCWYILLTWPEGMTVWVVILTFAVIGWQADETRKAATAANRQAEIAKDTAKRQLWAYFGSAEGKLYIRDDGSVEPRVTLTNCGQTPAYDFQVITCGRFETYPFKKAPRPGPDGSPSHLHIVGGGQPYYFTCDSVRSGKTKDSLLLELQSAGFAFILNGWCTYTDIFKDSHPIDFQLVIGGGTVLQRASDVTGEWLVFFTDSEGNASD